MAGRGAPRQRQRKIFNERKKLRTIDRDMRLRDQITERKLLHPAIQAVIIFEVERGAGRVREDEGDG